MIYDHAQIGNAVAHAHDIGQQRHAGIRRVQNQIGVGQGLEVGDKFRPVKFPAALPAQPVTNPAKERIFAEPVEIGFEIGRAGRQMSNGSHHDVVLGRDIQHPLVVFEQGAALDFNRSHDAQRLGDGTVSLRQGSLVENCVCAVGPGRASGPKRIVKVNVRVNDRNSSGRSCGGSRSLGCKRAIQSAGQRGPGKCGGAKKPAAGNFMLHQNLSPVQSVVVRQAGCCQLMIWFQLFGSL